MTERQILADRIHRYLAPRPVIFDALVDPAERDAWLKLAPREVEPTVVDAVEDRLVVWSSLWPVSPTDTITFDLKDYKVVSTALRFCWESDQPPDDRGVAITRQRLNRYLGDHLRYWVDSMNGGMSWDRQRPSGFPTSATTE